MQQVPFGYLEHLVAVPVTAGDQDARFVFDSGIGLTLVSEELAATLECPPTGSVFTGRRMSGQKVSLPLATIGSLTVAGYRRDDLVVGVFDMSAFPGFDGIGGFLSLDFFRETAVTVHYRAQELVVGERPPGVEVRVRVERDGPSAEIFMPLELPNGRVIEVEVDMGSEALILDERLADELGIDLRDAGIRKVEGRDETGYEYTRYFTTLRGDVRVPDSPALAQRDPDVMFQKIIYDGLVGHAFLRRFVVTYDLPHARLVFAQ